jgi:hypothetical protein
MPIPGSSAMHVASPHHVAIVSVFGQDPAQRAHASRALTASTRQPANQIKAQATSSPAARLSALARVVSAPAQIATASPRCADFANECVGSFYC